MRTDGYSGRFTLEHTNYLVAVAKSEETGNCVFLIDPIIRLSSDSLGRAAVILLLYMGLVCWILYDELGSRQPFEWRASIRREGDSATTEGIPWSSLPSEQKMGRVLRVCTYLFAAYLILLKILGLNDLAPETGLSYIMGGSWEKGINFYSVVGNLCLICVVFSAIHWVRAVLLSLAKAAGQHGETACRLAANVIKYVGVILCAYQVATNFGINAAAALASLGIAGIGLTFGAKSLIEDMIAGTFILFEGNFKVGDRLQIDEEIYEVKAIGVRTTTLESCGQWSIGKKKIINNSQMCGIVNVQNSKIKVNCDVQIGNEYDLDEIKAIFNRELPPLAGSYPPGTTTPEYKGVQALSATGTTIRIRCYSSPIDMSKAGRQLRLDVKRILERHGIHLPLTEYIVHTPAEQAEENGEENA